MKEVLSLIACYRVEGGPLALATVVAVEGSAYRRPGARLLVGPSGRLGGGISGGCLEDDVIRKALFLSEGTPRLLRYDASDEEVGLGCNGVIDVYLERLLPGPADPLTLAEAALRGPGPGVLARVYRGVPSGGYYLRHPDGREESNLGGTLLEDLRRRPIGDNWWGPVGDTAVFWEVLRPPQRLVLFGNGLDLLPLILFGTALGWRVTVVGDQQPERLRRRFADASELVVAAPRDAVQAARLEAGNLVVVMTHSLERDRQILPALLASPVAYVGVLGPRSRTARVLEGRTLTEHERQKLRSPVGLDLGGDGPEAVALSILAELQAVVQGRTGRPLSQVG